MYYYYILYRTIARGIRFMGTARNSQRRKRIDRQTAVTIHTE